MRDLCVLFGAVGLYLDIVHLLGVPGDGGRWVSGLL